MKQDISMFDHRHHRSLLIGEWVAVSEQEQALRALAAVYHQDCDTYDHQVCTGRHPQTGEAMPITPDEMELVDKHAREMREKLVCEGWSQDLTRDQVEQAIRKYCKG